MAASAFVKKCDGHVSSIVKHRSVGQGRALVLVIPALWLLVTISGCLRILLGTRRLALLSVWPFRIPSAMRLFVLLFSAVVLIVGRVAL